MYEIIQNPSTVSDKIAVILPCYKIVEVKTKHSEQIRCRMAAFQEYNFLFLHFVKFLDSLKLLGFPEHFPIS